MPLEHIRNLSDENVALFLEQFQNKPRLDALARSYLDSCQELEDFFWDIIDLRLIENPDDPSRRASGPRLDVIGKIVGQPRIGATDDVYRLHLRARIRINRSNGNANDVMAVVALLLQTSHFQNNEFYPASFVIDALEPMVEDPFFVASLIGEARAAGVGHSLHYSFDDEDQTFVLSDTDVAQDDAVRGLSHIDGSGAGGALIGAI